MPIIINLEGEIGWEVDVESIRNQLPFGGEDVVVNIASPGGLISEGLKIYNELKNYDGNVDTHLTGGVSSMASYIAMVGKHRTAEKNAVFMIHNGSSLVMGDHRLMFKAGKHFESLVNMIAKELAEKSGTQLKQIRKAMDETSFYYGDEIQKAGFVHEMIGDTEPENRDESIALAELMYEQCQANINTPDIIKKELKALSVMLADENNHQKPKKEKVIMTLEELKEKHPDIYSQVIALGVTDGVSQERARVKSLVEMRGKFPKLHSQNVIDQGIINGHNMSEISVNLMAADQAAAELEAGKKDKAKPPGDGGGDTPEMKDDNMTHPDHIDATSKAIASMPGVIS